MAKNSKRSAPKKPRNWIAVHAFQRGGGGNHGDKKKQSSKQACRKWRYSKGGD